MPSRTWGRFLLLAAPLSAVAVVLLGLLAGGARPIRSARVYGGPTQGQTELRLRLELGERDRVAEVPLAGTGFSLALLAGGERVARATGRPRG